MCPPCLLEEEAQARMERRRAGLQADFALDLHSPDAWKPNHKAFTCPQCAGAPEPSGHTTTPRSPQCLAIGTDQTTTKLSSTARCGTLLLASGFS
jgi:hypothetical protein